MATQNFKRNLLLILDDDDDVHKSLSHVRFFATPWTI